MRHTLLAAGGRFELGSTSLPVDNFCRPPPKSVELEDGCTERVETSTRAEGLGA